MPLRNLLTRKNIRRNIRTVVSIFVPTLFRSRVFVRLCAGVCSATLSVFLGNESLMQETRAHFDTRRHKRQSGTRTAIAALARVARAESIAQLRRRGARSCYSRVILAKKPVGASRVSPLALNHLRNSLSVRCSEMFRLLFACLTGETPRGGFAHFQANPGFFGKPGPCAVQQNIPANVSAGPSAGDTAGLLTGPNTGTIISIAEPITGPITGSITGLEHPVPRDQAFDFTGNSETEKFAQKNAPPRVADSAGTPPFDPWDPGGRLH